MEENTGGNESDIDENKTKYRDKYIEKYSKKYGTKSVFSEFHT